MRILTVNRRDTAEYTGESVKAQTRTHYGEYDGACERHHRGGARQTATRLFLPTRKSLTVPTLMPDNIRVTEEEIRGSLRDR